MKKSLAGLVLALGAAWYFSDPKRRERFPALTRIFDPLRR